MALVVNSSAVDIAPEASRLFSARGVCELALQKVGAFSPNDAAPDPNELDRALEWMEIEVAEFAEVNRVQWLIPATLAVTLTASEQSFDLADRAGADYPALGMAYPISASILDTTNSSEWPIDMVRRQQYEDHEKKDESGVPQEVYIDRMTDKPKVYVWPVQVDSTHSLKLVLQTYAPSMLGALSNQDQAGEVRHGFARGWQKWMVNQTAQAIGNGPVRRLDANTLKDIRAEAATSLTLLMRMNRENVSLSLRRTKRYGG